MPNLSVVATTNSFDDWLSDLTSAEKKTPEPIAFKDDPIAMACASYRAWKENFANRWLDLDAVVVQPRDREKAEELRKYYRGKMTFQALRDGNASMSTFRRKMAAIVSDTHTYTKEDIGILHRLPYFYDEDLATDEVFAATTDVDQETWTPIEFVGTLKPLKRVLRSRRAGEYIDFYFTSDVSTAPYLLVVKADNPLLSMIESFYKRPEFRVSANAYRKTPRGYHRNRMMYQLAALEVL